MKQILITLAACLLIGCYSNNSSDKSNVLQGAWTLRQVEYPYDRPDTYYKPENTLLRLYDGDSVVYQCWLAKTETGFIIRPELRFPMTLVDKGHDEYIYIDHKIKTINTFALDYNRTFFKSIEDRDINYSYYYEECYKLIDPIKLAISPNQKGDSIRKASSGKVLIRKYSRQYNTLFDDDML